MISNDARGRGETNLIEISGNVNFQRQELRHMSVKPELLSWRQKGEKR